MPAFIANNSLFPKLWWMNNSDIRVQHKGSSLQDKVTFTATNVVNSLFVYKLDKLSKNINVDFTIKEFVFEVFKFTINADQGKCSYSLYSSVFDSCSPFSLPNFDRGKNSVIVGVENSSSVYFNNKKRDILVIFEGPKQELGNTAITAGANNYINFSRSRKIFPYIYIIMEATGFYLLLPQK